MLSIPLHEIKITKHHLRKYRKCITLNNKKKMTRDVAFKTWHLSDDNTI